jgi:hypothetical protein
MAPRRGSRGTADTLAQGAGSGGGAARRGAERRGGGADYATVLSVPASWAALPDKRRGRRLWA